MAKKTATKVQPDTKPDTAEATRGRPPGAKNRDYVLSDAQPSRCPKCQSTDKGPYISKTEQPAVGVHDGKEYTHVIWRRCQCLACGQYRADRSFENRAE